MEIWPFEISTFITRGAFETPMFREEEGDPFWVRIVGSSLWSTSLMLGVARCRDRTPQAN